VEGGREGRKEKEGPLIISDTPKLAFARNMPDLPKLVTFRQQCLLRTENFPLGVAKVVAAESSKSS